MKVDSLRVRNFRSFADSGLLELGAINVLIGENNSGKSSLLKALNFLQMRNLPLRPDIRVGEKSCHVEIQVSGVPSEHLWYKANHPVVRHVISLPPPERGVQKPNWQIITNDRTISEETYYQLENCEPNHFIVPFLSKRKIPLFSEDISLNATIMVQEDMGNLSAKLSRIANPSFPFFSQFEASCRDILGFLVTAIPSEKGQVPGVYLPSGETIEVKNMGEGVANIVQLLINLATSENKLFLIEELENDIHPGALKSLLDLIVVSSKRNQFVISTHSNIVVRNLCSEPNSKLWRIQTTPKELPFKSTAVEVEPTSEARQKVLTELGYSLSDFGLWSGYLILEESSAERIIRDYLIPFFVPDLHRVRTVSASGVGNVEPTFTELNRLALFMHLEPMYTGKAWVIVDGDEPGRKLINDLKGKYRSWDEKHFRCFTEPSFENYYPAEFSDRVRKVLENTNKEQKRREKKELLDQVIAWLDEDEVRARKALDQSAREVIELLGEIQTNIITAGRLSF